MPYLAAVFLFLLFCLQAGAQPLLKGKVMDSRTDSALAGATVYNLSQHIYKKAGFDGSFTVIADRSDTIVFSSAGYWSDTVALSIDLLQQGLTIGLKARSDLLKSVTVRSRSYTADSMERREDYKAFYDRHFHTLIDKYPSSGGFGLRFGLLTYFSKNERANRRLKKQLAYNEEQSYIDYNFSPSYVHQLTGLRGDSLQVFMVRYRPPYHFVRNASMEDLSRYVNDALVQFHSPEKAVPASRKRNRKG